MTETGKGTLFHLRVKGIDIAHAGQAYGAHLHVGPCVEGTAPRPVHYNASTTTPPVVSDQTEVWLDFTVADDGTGAGDALVPFVPMPGERAVVIHAEATAPNGTAGPRWSACRWSGDPARSVAPPSGSRSGRPGVCWPAGVDALDHHRPGVQLVGHADIISLSAVLGLGVGVVDAARRTSDGPLDADRGSRAAAVHESGMLLAPSFPCSAAWRGGAGRAARVVGLLAVAGSVGVGIWAGLGDITVTYVVGYVALAWRSPGRSWCGSGRSGSRLSPKSPGRRDRPERVSPHV